MNLLFTITHLASLWTTICDNVIGAGSAWFWAMVQAVAVAVTLFLIHRQIRLQRLGNMLSSLQELDLRWSSDGMLSARASVCSNAFKNGVEVTDADDAVLVFFEDLGMQVKRGILDTELVWDTYSVFIEFYWPILKPIIEEQWNRGDKTLYEDFKKLYEAMAKIAKKRKTKHEKTREELKRFAAGEASRLPLTRSQSSLTGEGAHQRHPLARAQAPAARTEETSG